jgi:hypothetical protein
VPAATAITANHAAGIGADVVVDAAIGAGLDGARFI